MTKNSKITEWLRKTNSTFFAIYAIIAAFSTYTCMYAFRKPISVGIFAGADVWGLDFKSLVIISQIIGYTLSKFLGIKFISEMKPGKRASAILLLIGIAEIALLFFAIIPAPYNASLLFLNGLVLGMIWGLVFSFLEGRKLTELLGAGLSISFIFSSGFVKSVGKLVMDLFGVSEYWMPFTTGLVFVLPLLFFVWMLNKLPPPSKEDEELRTERVPMNGKERMQFFAKFASGIIVLTLIYMFLTAFRDLRDNYMVDIWTTLGYTETPMIFTYTEIPIAIIVLVVMGSIIFIKDNMKALLVNHFIILGGILMVGLGTLAFQNNMLSAPLWMMLTGLGLYMGYVPFNCILFDRFIATYKTAANAGFLIYIADAFGYLSSVTVVLYKNFGYAEISWFNFFIEVSYMLLIFGGALTLISIIYFTKKSRQLSLAKTALAESSS